MVELMGDQLVYLKVAKKELQKERYLDKWKAYWLADLLAMLRVGYLADMKGTQRVAQ